MHRPIAEKIVRFFTVDLWCLKKEELPKSRAIGLTTLRVAALTVKDYMRDNCALRASALTFYSLLSIVPVVALAFGIAKGFGLEQRLESQLHQRFAGQEEVISRVIDFARTLLENTKGGLIAGIGVLLLFWSAIKVLNHIETTLNHIWKVQARTAIRKFTDYLSIMIISPLLVVVSSSVNVYITAEITALASKLALLQAASPFIFFLLKLLPFGLIWLLFILIYLVMPNTQVRFPSALLAGIIAGSIYQILQGIYISTQVLVSKYNAIYGSFAALPFFLMWLQLSWMIVLLGAEIAYAHQHVGHFSIAADYRHISTDLRRRYALHILRLVIGRFQEGRRPLTVDQIAKTLKLPYLMVSQLIDDLQTSHLVSAVRAGKNNGQPAYQPARDINGITIGSVLEALDKAGGTDWPAYDDPGFGRVSQALDDVQAAIRNGPADRLVKDL
jgi:membrane protein